MKIAFIFPRLSGPYGGERLLFSLAKGFIDAGNEVTLYSAGPIESVQELKPKNLEFVTTDRISFGGHQLKNFLDFFKMPFVALKIQKDYDYVIGMGWQSAFCLYVLAKLRHFRKERVIYYCLEPPRFLYDLRGEAVNKTKHQILSPMFALIRYLDLKSVKFLPHSIAISDWTADQIEEIYGKTVPIVYPGVEIERFKGKSKADARKKLSLQAKDEIYLSVSKLHPRKRLKDSIDIYLRHQSNNSKYFIIGDGPDRPNIEEYIKSVGNKNIFLLGKLSDEEVTNYMVAGDYFIFTAVNEPFGIAPLEAQVAGCTLLPKPFERPIVDWQTTSKHFLEILGSF